MSKKNTQENVIENTLGLTHYIYKESSVYAITNKEMYNLLFICRTVEKSSSSYSKEQIEEIESGLYRYVGNSTFAKVNDKDSKEELTLRTSSHHVFIPLKHHGDKYYDNMVVDLTSELTETNKKVEREKAEKKRIKWEDRITRYDAEYTYWSSVDGDIVTRASNIGSRGNEHTIGLANIQPIPQLVPSHSIEEAFSRINGMDYTIDINTDGVGLTATSASNVRGGIGNRSRMLFYEDRQGE